MNRQDWAPRSSDDLLGDTAHQDVPKPSSAMCAHDDYVESATR
jgi:hypothetical protein